MSPPSEHERQARRAGQPRRWAHPRTVAESLAGTPGSDGFEPRPPWVVRVASAGNPSAGSKAASSGWSWANHRITSPKHADAWWESVFSDAIAVRCHLPCHFFPPNRHGVKTVSSTTRWPRNPCSSIPTQLQPAYSAA